VTTVRLTRKSGLPPSGLSTNGHGQVHAGFLQKHYPQLYQQGLWLFRDRDSALRVPGFTPEDMRLRTYWDIERVISQIQLLRRTSFPLYPAYVLRPHPELFAAAIRIFGSWANALIAAGLEVPDSPHDGRRGVLRGFA
jgi:hypothetical protein